MGEVNELLLRATLQIILLAFFGVPILVSLALGLVKLYRIRGASRLTWSAARGRFDGAGKRGPGRPQVSVGVQDLARLAVWRGLDRARLTRRMASWWSGLDREVRPVDRPELEGVDLVVDGSALVRCHSGPSTVGPAQVREIFGALHERRGSRATLVAAGRVTPEAASLARALGVEMIAGEELARLQELRDSCAELEAIRGQVERMRRAMARVLDGGLRDRVATDLAPDLRRALLHDVAGSAGSTEGRNARARALRSQGRSR